MTRDAQIINDLERFRVMSRDDIIDLYFSHLKNPINCANTVLKRLVRDNQITVSGHFRPFVYFPVQSTIKQNSTKIPHFLKIVDVYKQLKPHVDKFNVEPKFTKGLAEPDIFCKIKGKHFFIEIQRNVYSQRVMNQKIKRYETLSYEFDQFPYIIMITEHKYEIDTELTVFQVGSIDEFMNNITPPRKIKSKGIQIKVG